MTAKEKISLIINGAQGLKGTEVIMHVVSEYPSLLQEITGSEIGTILDELAQEHEIVEFQYILPHMNYRIKSMYFPRGTKMLKE